MSPAPDAPPEGQDESIGKQFSFYWRVIRKRWPIAALVLILTVVGVFVWTYRQPRVYEATCSIMIDPMAPQVLSGVKDVVELGTGSYWANKEFYETQYRVVASLQVARRVVDKLALVPEPGTVPLSDDPDAVPRSLLKTVSVKPVKDSRIANIIVRGTDPKKAAAIANAFADAYMEENLNFKLEGSHLASAWLGDQVVDLAKKLRESEVGLYEYKKRNQLLDVSLHDRQSMTTQNMQSYNGKLAEIRTNRIALESTRKQILLARSKIEERESLPEIQNSQAVQQFRVNFLLLAKEKAELESSYGERHPKVVSVSRQLEAVQRNYENEIDKVLGSHEKAYQALLDSEKALEKLIEREKVAAIGLSKVELEYRPLSREAENTERLYSMVTQRQKETSITGLIRTNNVRLLDVATAPRIPVSPKVSLNMTVALLGGLLLGLSLCVLLEAMDSTLKTQEEVESLLGVPVLGILPIIGDKTGPVTPEQQRERDLGVFFDPKSSAAEACRSIRTNLLFLSPEKPIRSLVVTSPGPQEGKTTTAVSIAITMAQAGAKVLLIDTDLRRPRVHRAFNAKNEIGISNVIVGERSLEDAVQSTIVPNLFILPCGPTPPNPAELLHSARFNAVHTKCLEQFERVIYDSPPTSAVTDPAIVGNLADGVLLVAKAGKTSRDAALAARRQLFDARAKVVGTVLNHVDFSDRSYGLYYTKYYKAYGGYYGPREDAAKA
jgi:polysaccharide biosynthesis transport protein